MHQGVDYPFDADCCYGTNKTVTLIALFSVSWIRARIMLQGCGHIVWKLGTWIWAYEANLHIFVSIYGLKIGTICVIWSVSALRRFWPDHEWNAISYKSCHHIFTFDYPLSQEYLSCMISFQRFGDLGRTISEMQSYENHQRKGKTSEAHYCSRSTPYWIIKLRGAIVAPQTSGREVEGSNLDGGSSFLASLALFAVVAHTHRHHYITLKIKSRDWSDLPYRFTAFSKVKDL